MYKEIIQYAEDNGLAVKENRATVSVSAYIKLTEDGEYNGIAALDNPVSIIIPDFGTKAATANQANAIVDKIGYILNPEYKEKKTKSYLENIATGADKCRSLKAIHTFLTKYYSDKEFHDKVCNDWKTVTVKVTEKNGKVKEKAVTVKDGAIVSWMIGPEKVEDMQDDWNDWLLERIDTFRKGKGDDSGEKMIISSVSGKLQHPVPKAGGPAIKNINAETKGAFASSKGALATACFVASAKEDAFSSYGLSKADTFQMGIDDANALVAGLEHLLDSEDNRDKSFKTIFFYDGDYEGDVENILKESFKGMDLEEAEEHSVNMLENSDSYLANILNAVKTGEAPFFPKELENIRYHMCHFVAPTRGRFLISDEMHITYKELAENLYKWYRDTCINYIKYVEKPANKNNSTGTDGKEDAKSTDKKDEQKSYKAILLEKSIMNFYSIFLSCLNDKNAENIYEQVDKEFGSLRMQLLRAIYTGSQIPAVFYRRALEEASKTFVSKSGRGSDRAANKKTKTESDSNGNNSEGNSNEFSFDGSGRKTPNNIKTIYAQIIKCYLNRKGYHIMKEVSKNVSPAYACGKLFATMDQLQNYYYYKKDRTLNQTLAQAHFKAAQSHPARTFAIISKFCNVYLDDLDDKKDASKNNADNAEANADSKDKKSSAKAYYSRLFAEICDEIGEYFPETLNLDEQGAFALGYYHQKGELMKSKKKDDNKTNGDATEKSAN